MRTNNHILTNSSYEARINGAAVAVITIGIGRTFAHVGINATGRRVTGVGGANIEIVAISAD